MYAQSAASELVDGEEEFYKLTVNLPADIGDVLKELKASHHSTLTAMLQQSILLYAYIDRETRKGQQLVLRDPATGSSRELVWLRLPEAL